MNSTVIFRKPGPSNEDACCPPDESRNNRKVVMIVDDQSVVRRCLELTAKRASFTEVETYDNAMSALDAFRLAPDSYQVVITDYHMPGLTGTELIKRIQSIQPDQSIILMSAALSAKEAGIENNPRCRFLRKPFDWLDLTREIDDLENGRTAKRI